MHCMIFFFLWMKHLNQALNPLYCCCLLQVHLTDCPHQLVLLYPGGEKLSPGRSSGWEPAADWWFSSFLNTASHSCGGKAAPGCFVVTSVSRTAGCLQREEEEEGEKKIYSLICSGPDCSTALPQQIQTPWLRLIKDWSLQVFFLLFIFSPQWLNTVHFVAACRL